MKNRSVLAKRAVLLAAIVACVTVAVQLPVFLILNERLSNTRTQTEVLRQARQIAGAGNDSAEYMGAAAMLDEMGGIVWLCDATGVRVITNKAVVLPTKAASAIAGLRDGEVYTQALRIGTTRYRLAAVPAFASGGVVTAAFAVAMPMDQSSAPMCAMIALLCGLAAAVAAGAAGVVVFIAPASRQLIRLKKTALTVADGSLSMRADENGAGEIGELGRAINRISSQLSGSMYTLIVERNRLKSVLNGLNEGIVAVDASGQITHTNPAMERLYAQAKSRLLYLPDARLSLIPDASVWEDFDRVIASGETVIRSYEVRDMVIRMTISPIRDELESIAGAVGLFSDITQMERLERTRREYVSNVSHELRTPLTAVRALVEPLKDGLVNTEEDRQRYYDIILREVMRLSRLINDQLELSRLQSGTVAIEKKKLRLEDMVMDVCDRYSAIAEEHGLELKVDTDFSECPPVFANEDRAEQLLIILLDNAIKYTEQGSVSLSGTWDDEKVTLTVSDTGIGISEKDLPYVFDRFYKVDKAHSGKGSGLGLSIAHELMGRMDEKMWVDSELGRGTSFSFTLHRAE